MSEITKELKASMRRTAKEIRKSSVGDIIVIGPVLVYSEDQWRMGFVRQLKNGKPQTASVDFGSYAPDLDDLPQYMKDSASSIWSIKRGDELTTTEANCARDYFIEEIERLFSEADCYDSERDFVVAVAAHFPSRESRELRDGVIAEIESRAL